MDAWQVITASFPGPAVYAKQARGEMVRFCAEEGVSRPEELAAFRGAAGAWRYVPEASDPSTYVFHRGAAKAKAAPKRKGEPKGKAKAEEGEEGEDEGGAAAETSAGGRRRKE